MEYQIDAEKLRRDLKNYYGTAMFSVSPMAVMDLSRVELTSDQELVRMAEEKGVDLRKYIVW